MSGAKKRQSWGLGLLAGRTSGPLTLVQPSITIKTMRQAARWSLGFATLLLGAGCTEQAPTALEPLRPESAPALQVVPANIISTFTVTNTNDAGLGSLRQAILDANLSAGQDLIDFNLQGAGPHTIQPGSALPTITDPVVIDGYSQPGAIENTNLIDQPSNVVLKIVLRGLSAGSSNGLTVQASSTIRGLVIGRFGGSGILVEGSGGNSTIQGNYIGLDVNGFVPNGNSGHGLLFRGASGNLIGGTLPADRNVISANTGLSGIRFDASTGNLVQGNFIGTDGTGMWNLGNARGIEVIRGSNNNLIGGIVSQARNVIAGNPTNQIATATSNFTTIQGNYLGVGRDGSQPMGGLSGIFISSGAHTIGGDGGVTPGGPCTGACNVISANEVTGVFANFSSGTTIRGNFIGTDASGTLNRGNGRGIWFSANASNNQIGGTGAGEGNLISGNAGPGIVFEPAFGGSLSGNSALSNRIGTQADGISPLPNSTGIRIGGGSSNHTIGGVAPGAANVIAFNAVNGVVVSGAGATGNRIRYNSIHANGFRGIENLTGGNTELAPPVITSTSPTTVSGTACPNCEIDVFSDQDSEGEKPEATTVADGAGNWTANGVFTGPNITATATDASGNTSEFPNLPPVAVDDASSTTMLLPATINVRANDSDPDGDPIAVASITQGSDGTASVNADGNVTYQPACGFVGTASFTYTIGDGQGGTDTATVSVTISRPGRPEEPGRPPTPPCTPR